MVVASMYPASRIVVNQLNVIYAVDKTFRVIKIMDFEVYIFLNKLHL